VGTGLAGGRRVEGVAVRMMGVVIMTVGMMGMAMRVSVIVGMGRVRRASLVPDPRVEDIDSRGDDQQS